MKIIVDMMGGDNAPLAVLEGTAQAVKEYGVQVIGVGSEELVRKTAAEHISRWTASSWSTAPRPLRCAMSLQGPSAARRIPPSWWA